MTDLDLAAAFFADRLAFQTDVSDVYAALPTSDFVVIDARSSAAWEQGHLPGAVHLPHPEIASRARGLLDPAVPVVAYCWGPGCNGATRAALALTRSGYAAREMIGGVEYWIREGFPIVTEKGETRRAVDSLTAIACGC